MEYIKWYYLKQAIQSQYSITRNLYTGNDMIITHMNNVFDGFNSFFVGVGPEHANKITNTLSGGKCSSEDFGERNQTHSIFLWEL